MERSKEDYLKLIITDIKKQYLGNSNLNIDPETLETLIATTGVNGKDLRAMFAGTYSKSIQPGTLKKLCYALDKDSFQEYVDSKNSEEEDLIELVVTDKKVTQWLEKSTIGRQSLEFNEKHYGISQPLVVPVQFASDSSYWKNWAFCSAILNEPLKFQKINSKFRLHVSVHEEDLGIYNNAGKKFLHELHSKKEKISADEKRSQDLNEFIHSNTEGSEFTIESLPLRWASSGVLPIAHFIHPKHIKRTDWILLFYRDLNPTAWTIPLGGSHNSEEFTNLTKLLFREFSEEILILDRHPSEKRVFQKLFFHPDRSDNEYISHEFTKVQRELRSRQDGISIALSGNGNEVEIETVRSRMEVSVNEIYTRNISISVNPKEMGIEAVKIVKFDLEQSDYILDGEFSENDSPFLIRRPAMLLSLDFLKNQFERTGMIGEEFQGKDQFLRDCKVVKNLSEHDYYLYDHEIELRKKRFEFLQASSLKNETELNFHKKWFKNHGKKFEHKAISKEILLAPVVWKTLEHLISK